MASLDFIQQLGTFGPPGNQGSGLSYPIVPSYVVPGTDEYTNLSPEDYARFQRHEPPTQTGNAAGPGGTTPAPTGTPAGAAGTATTAPAVAPAAPVPPQVPFAASQGQGWEGSPLETKIRNAENPNYVPPGQAAPAQPPPSGTKTGLAANLAAGGNEAAAAILGAPADIGAAFLNDLTSFRNRHMPNDTPIPAVTNPLFGSRSIQGLMGGLGANPQNVVASDAADQAARTFGSGAVSLVAPWGAARAIPALSGVPGAIQSAFGQGSAAMQAFMGGTGAVAGTTLEDAVPPEYKPLANLVGNVAGMGAVALPAAAARSVARGASGAISPFFAPLGTGPKVTPIDPVTGEPFTHTLSGQPIQGVRRSRMALAGNAIARGTGMTPQEAVGTIPETPEGTIGQPTIGQLLNSPKALAYEHQLRLKNRSAFTAQESANNRARVLALAGIAPPEDAAMVAGDFFRKRLRQIEAMTPQEAAQAALAERARNALPDTGHAEAGARMREAIGAAQAPSIGASERAIAGARGAAEGATAALGGGQETRLQAAGSDIQSSLDLLDRFKKQQVDQIYDAVDPDGKLAVDMRPVAAERAAILRDVSKFDKPFSGETGAILDSTGEAKPVEKFSDFRRLRSRITDELRVVRSGPNADATATRALSRLLSSADDVMSGAVGEQAAQHAGAVAVGKMSPEATIGARMAEATPPGAAASFIEPPTRIVAPAATPPPREARLPEETAIPGAPTQAPTLDLPILKPNATPADIASYQRANAEHRTRMRTYHEGAVGDVLTPGARKGEFAREASTVAPTLFNRKSTSAEDIQSFVHAIGGHTDDEARAAFGPLALGADGKIDQDALAKMMGARRQALENVERSAAFSLRTAAEENGTLNPAKAKTWMDAHAPALDALPNLRARFENAVEMRRRLDDVHAERKALDDLYPLANERTDAGLAGRYWKTGATGREAVQQYIRDSGGSPQAMSILDDLALSTLRRQAVKEGEWSQGAFDRWRESHRASLEARPQLAATVDTFQKAQNAVADAAARRQDFVRAYQESAIKHYLTKAGEPVDPQTAMTRLIGSPTGPQDAKQLMALMGNDTAAVNGLRLDLFNYMQNKIQAAVQAAGTDDLLLKNLSVQKLMGEGKTRRVVEQVLTPEQVEIWDKVSDSLLTQARAVQGAKIPGSPGTAADLHSLEGEHGPNLLTQLVIGELGGSYVERALHATGKFSAALRAAATVGSVVAAMMRSAGFRSVADLEAQGVLQPELGRILNRAAITEQKSPIFGPLARRIAAAGAASAGMAPTRRDR